MKRIRETSVATYLELEPSLQKRERVVLTALTLWNGPAPTSYELTCALQRMGLAFDVNSVRPRISSLQDKGLVRTGAKRRCTVTGKTSYTWELVPANKPQTLLAFMEAH